MLAAREDAMDSNRSFENKVLSLHRRSARNAPRMPFPPDRSAMSPEPLNALHQYRSKLAALDQGQLLSCISRCTGDHRPADDLLQEVYERLLRIDSDRAAKIQCVQRYAFGVIRHVVQDWRARRRNSRIEYLGRPEDFATTVQHTDVEEIVSAQQEIALLYSEIKRFPRRCREILILVKVFGYSAKEVSLNLRIAESTVKKQLQIAALRCHEALNSTSARPGLLLLSRVLGRRRERV